MKELVKEAHDKAQKKVLMKMKKTIKLLLLKWEKVVQLLKPMLNLIIFKTENLKRIKKQQKLRNRY
jgi:hypothetical protein